VTELAHWDSALLTLIRLLSRDKQSLTVDKLLCIAEGNWALFEHVERDVVLEKVRRDRARIKELEPLLQKLKNVRDKYVAHLDASTLKQASRRIQGKDLHPIDRVEQVNLQGVAQSIVASYYEMYHDCEFDFGLGEHSYSWLLSVLVERGRQHNEKRAKSFDEVSRND
jgi:hypothetical protein